MNDDDRAFTVVENPLAVRLRAVRQEHQDLDDAISALEQTPGYDQLRVMRMKKSKLQLRDEMTRLEDQMRPDIIA